MSEKQKKEKIFLNAMDSWFSNFIIETFRTDHLPEAKLQTEFMGTINDEENLQLPLYFTPQIISFDYNPAYKSELFNNDIFIYNLNTGNLKEVHYLIKGLKTIRLESEKIIILISNIMTWEKTPNKMKSDNPDEIVFVHPDDALLEEQKKLEELRKLEEKKKLEEQKKLEEENKEQNRNNEEQNNEENKEENKENKEDNNNEQEKEKKEQTQVNEQDANNSVIKEKSVNESKLSSKQNQSHLSQNKENNEGEEKKPIYVYWTDKDYLQRKSSSKYLEYKFIENEALLLNQKINIKAYVICPGIVYGFGEKTFYSIFRSALLNFPIEEILLDKGRNIIPTIHMRDLVNIISKIIEKKPSSHYILAFDQTNNRTLKNIIKSIYHCIGDENMMCPKKEEVKKEETEEGEEKEEKENNEENEENNEENEHNEENEEKKEGEESIEEQKIEETKKEHPFFSNKKYMLPEYFPKELLHLDLKLLPSEFLKGEPKERYYSQLSSENNKEKPIEYNPLFKWHCPNGIISNIQSIRKEFIKYRNLNSNKILILGNPYTGKTTISQILSKIFHLPIIDIKSFVNYGKKLAGIETDEEKKLKEEINNNNPDENNAGENINENENEKKIVNINISEENEFVRKSSLEKDLINDIQKAMKELDERRAEAEEAYNKRPNKKKTDPPFDDHMYYRFNDELMVNILKRRLEKNDTNTYGFIIDGFPKNYAQLKELFKEGEKSIAYPNSILLFENIEDDFVINRIKTSEEFPKDPKDPNINIILERVYRRLAKLKEEKNEEGYKTLKEFFEEEENKNLFKDKLKIIEGKNSILDIIKDVQEFIKNNNNNQINQIDTELECTEYEYDYVKIEEEKNKPPEEPEEVKEDPQKKEEPAKASTKNVIVNENIPKKEEEKDKDNEKDKDKEKEKSKKNNDTTRKEETIYEETKNSQDILNTKDGEEKEKKVEIVEEKKPKTQLEIEKENEFKLLEKKSEVLRRYLAENVLPLLSLGILHVATERPDDPVEALADYLLAKTFETKKNDEGELDENIKVEKNDNDDKNNSSIDLNLDNHKDDEVNLNLDIPADKEKNNDKNKIPRNLSPIHRENSNGENIDDELNKGMIDPDE